MSCGEDKGVVVFFVSNNDTIRNYFNYLWANSVHWMWRRNEDFLHQNLHLKSHSTAPSIEICWQIPQTGTILIGCSFPSKCHTPASPWAAHSGSIPGRSFCYWPRRGERRGWIFDTLFLARRSRSNWTEPRLLCRGRTRTDSYRWQMTLWDKFRCLGIVSQKEGYHCPRDSHWTSRFCCQRMKIGGVGQGFWEWKRRDSGSSKLSARVFWDMILWMRGPKSPVATARFQAQVAEKCPAAHSRIRTVWKSTSRACLKQSGCCNIGASS